MNEQGLHDRMGGRQEEKWNKDGSVEPSFLAGRNTRETGSLSNGEWKSYFKSMASHRESMAEMRPESLYDQDIVLDPDCVVTGEYRYRCF